MTIRFLRRADVEDLTGLSRSTIYAMMKRGEFPQGIAIAPAHKALALGPDRALARTPDRRQVVGSMSYGSAQSA